MSDKEHFEESKQDMLINLEDYTKAVTNTLYIDTSSLTKRIETVNSYHKFMKSHISYTRMLNKLSGKRIDKVWEP